MVIKFIKNYKNYKKDDVVKVNSLAGNKLIKGGLAKTVEKAYKIKNLYVAPIIEPKCKLIFHSDGIVRHVGVFTKDIYGFINEKPLYTHVLTGRKYITNSLIEYDYTEDLVIDETKEKAFGKYFLRKMIEKQWTENSIIDVEDVKLLENKLNGITIKQTDNGREF